jgi:hypothetical protein
MTGLFLCGGNGCSTLRPNVSARTVLPIHRFLPSRTKLLGVTYRRPGSVRLSVASGIDWFDVEGYVDFTGGVKAYGVVDLRVLGDYDWRLSDRNVWKVEEMLLEWPHRRVRSSKARIDALRRKYRAFREAHGYKPWKYYKGRDRWTELPKEFGY